MTVLLTINDKISLICLQYFIAAPGLGDVALWDIHPQHFRAHRIKALFKFLSGDGREGSVFFLLVP